MIELLLSYNIDTGEALLHAIDEEFVEGDLVFFSIKKMIR